MVKKLLFTLFLVLVQTVVFAATNTYLGSTTVGGKLLWSTAANWSLGAVPTATDDVVIPSGKTVTLDVTPVYAKSLTISGTLDLNKNADITINTQLIVVTSPNGQINFDHSIIRLPSNVALYLQNGSGSLNGSCNNNDEVFVGTVQYAVCVGGGALYLFAEIEAAGGINVVTAGVIGASQLICSGATPATLTSTTASTGSGTITYEWQTNATGSYVTIPGATSSTYPPPALTTITSYQRRTVSMVEGKTFYSAYTTPVTITVTANNTVGAASSTPTLCINTALTNITYATTGATGIGASTGLPAGVIAAWASNIITISGTPTASGIFSYSIPLIGGCGSVSATGTITVNSIPTAPTFASVDITQPNCSIVTGSVVLSGLPASGTWTLTRSGTSSATISGTGTSTTISGLSVGTYYYTVSNGTCASVASSGVTINNQVTNTWNGSVWSTGLAPTSSEKIVFDGFYSSAVNLNACSCQVNSGKSVTILSGGTLKLTNELTVLGTGTLTFENNSSLVQINNAAINTGSITYRRQTTPIGKFDYTYWSSPVSPQTLYNVSPNTLYDKFFSYNSTSDTWTQENPSNNMVKGAGYIIRGPQNFAAPTPPGLYEANFKGVPNNGTITIPIGGLDSLNLIGNPYPSALDANKFLMDNSAVLDGTLYFWTHNTAIQLASGITNGSAGSGDYAYTSDDYASYNLTGGVGTDGVTYAQGGNVAGSGGQKPSGKIASGQGFFATGKSSGTATFNNSMRVGVGTITGDNSQFFKMTNSKTTSLIEKHRVWLNLTNSEGAFKQTLLGYVTNATNGYDNSYDGESFDGNQFIDFYSVNEDKNLAIQGRALPFDENDEVTLGFSSTIEGAFSISIDEVDGLFTSQDVFIEDKNTNSIKNLKDGPYTFTTESGTFNDRFVLRYVNANKTLDTGSFEILENTVLVSNKNKLIKINSPVETINKVQVYDLLGRSVYQKLNVDVNELTISNLFINNQVLLVKILLQNGKTITKKIIY
ncbi:T9SS sorting signal type C domain-containing protein [Flavobacterium sp. GB2R13]|uniref:T9SS sorting signal type C domain-containing protein n=1 Tax=Flavobacterium algoris TaxID=3398733 RepID=UPI003A8BF7B6